jgi:hypothetical protein
MCSGGSDPAARNPAIRLAVLALFVLLCRQLLALDLSDPSEPWRTSRTGVAAAVPAPFEELAVTGQKVSCWGREYSLGAPLPRQIVSQGEALLAAPMRLVVQQKGETATLADHELRVTRVAADRIEFAGQVQAADLQVQSAGWLEYDGMMQVQLTVSPGAAANLERLALEIPCRTEVAKYFHISSTWGKYVYDRIGEAPGWKFGVDWQALAWVGDHDRGLTFVTEAPGSWSGAGDHALELERTPQAVVLRANVIGAPTELTAPRTWTLGLQATPGKPLPPTWHGRYVGFGGVQEAHVAAAVAARGQTATCIWNADTAAFSYPQAKDDAVLRATIKAYHEVGVSVVVYVTLSGTGAETGVMARHRDEWVMTDKGKPVFEQPDPSKHEHMVSTCPASGYADWLVWAVDRAMDEYGLDGVYIDNAGPYYCDNPRHGCGLAGGRTYPYFANRDLHKRLWNVVHGRRPDTGLIWEHSSRTSNSLNLTFVDVYSDGEQFHIATGPLAGITPVLLEISATGRQWGAQPSFLVAGLNLREQYTDWLLARLLPYGNVVVVEQPYMDVSRLAPVLRARRDFGLGREAVEWHTPEKLPEWLPVGPRELLVGAYVRSDRKVLLNLGNPTDTPLAARLDLGAASAKLGGPVAVTDALTGVPCPPIGKQMVLALPANSFRVVRLESRP